MTRGGAADAAARPYGRAARRPEWRRIFSRVDVFVADILHPFVDWRWASRTAAFVLALAILGVVALTVHHLRSERSLAIRAAAREVDMRATLLAERLDAALRTAPDGAAAGIFRRVVASDPESRFPRAVLLDRTGRTVATMAPDGAQVLPDDFLGGDDVAHLDTLGVRRLASDGDDDRFAVVRPLPATAGRV